MVQGCLYCSGTGTLTARSRTYKIVDYALNLFGLKRLGSRGSHSLSSKEYKNINTKTLAFLF